MISFEHQDWSKILFGRKHLWPILDQFLSTNSPILKAFGGLETAKMAENGLKMGLEKHVAHPFWPPKEPIFKAFWDLPLS